MMFDPHFHTSRFILEKLLKDNFHTRKKRTVNIPDDRVLQLTQQILEMLKSMVNGYHVSAIKVPIQPIADCTWIMDGRSGRREYCIGPGSSIILFVHPFPQYLIKVGYGCGWGSSVE